LSARSSPSAAEIVVLAPSIAGSLENSRSLAGTGTAEGSGERVRGQCVIE
jgi:hypothetical protein